MARKDQQLHDLLEPTVEALGYELWGLEYLSAGKHSVLRLYIEGEQGITVDDCALVSQQGWIGCCLSCSNIPPM